MSHETFKAPDLDQLAELLPSYDFEAFIAQGGMGAVYKATQRSLDRTVAIKILPRELGEDPEFRKSFETEAKAMAKLNHPNLIGVYDYGDLDGMPYIVMEYVDGKSLYHSAWNKIVEPEQAVTIAKGILSGLGHAHEHGILHRDIKPANILLTPKAEPKIGDFGLAGHADAEGPGTMMGTPGYAAPEITQAPDKVGTAADIFAVGVILHELLTGERPDPGNPNPQPIRDRRLDAIWRKATDPDLTTRYDQAEDMLADLEKWRSSPRLATGASKGTQPMTIKRRSAPPSTGIPLAAQPGTQITAALSPNPAGKTPAATPGTRQPIPSQTGSTKPPTVNMSTGGNWSLTKNALIGAVLIAAIVIGFKLMKKADQDSDDSEIRKKRDEFAQMTEDDRKEVPDEDPPPSSNSADGTPTIEDTPPEPPGPEPEKKSETALEVLERLKPALASGKREEFPPGTKRRGEEDFLFIETPMPWYQALAFAREHGGDVSVVKTPEELTWVSQLVPEDIEIWLGAGRAGRNVWSVNDGSDWTLDASPRGVGPFAKLNRLGNLRAGKVGEAKPFVIQWHRDGSNPATLRTILKRTRDTLDTPNPIFPPGTESIGARHMLILPLPMNRREAAELAELGGGTLAVPATRQEAGWLGDELESYEGSSGFWLGARRQSGDWTWDTGEGWDHVAWTDDAEPTGDGDALVIVPTKGWTNAEAHQSASGLVIEWSDDAP